ncbi:MAG: RpiB/LacA/LacB family sugar-phosphate isomerase, partial [Candidatus Omnitrophica bacterium]|nr:RpiB/LacA/LacB family sugar-phosphate isomerase [Candidatus Omnitrophota bacterium]
KVAFACDHRGYRLKQPIFQILKKLNCDVIDCGTDSEDSSDYPDFILRAAEKLGSGTCSRAIGVCHTGIGSSILANKVRGVYAALVHTVEEAQLSRAHNNANMLILGAGFIQPEILESLIRTWLTTSFEGGRHERRVQKIYDYEAEHSR